MATGNGVTRGIGGYWRFRKWGPVFEHEPPASGARGADGGWKRPPPPPPATTRQIQIERKLLHPRQLHPLLDLYSYVLIMPVIATHHPPIPWGLAHPRTPAQWKERKQLTAPLLTVWRPPLPRPSVSRPSLRNTLHCLDVRRPPCPPRPWSLR